MILVLLNKEKISELHNSEVLFSVKILSYEKLTKVFYDVPIGLKLNL